MTPLFVYGTLQKGRENEHLLSRIGGEWIAATIHGTYYPKAWGLAAGFPGVILDDHADEVPGYLFAGFPGVILNDHADEVPGYLFISPQLADHWPELDEFEAGYDRLLTTATTADGQRYEAWVYQVQPPCSA